jgi:hypothetical protein
MVGFEVKIYSNYIELKQEPNLGMSQPNSQDDVSLADPTTVDSEDQNSEDLVSTYMNPIHATKLKPFIGL